MGFLSGNTASIPDKGREDFGIPQSGMATNEQARCVPVFYGKRRLGVTWLGERFNVYYETDDDKKAGETRTYYAGYKAAVCMGPVDGLHEIWMDRRLVWSGALARDTTADKLISIRVTNPGADYSADATLDITNVVATARPIIKGGRIVEVILETQGETVDLENLPVITASDATGTGATFTPVIGSESFVDVSIAGIGDWRFYWGTDEQDYDSTLVTLSEDTDRNPSGVTTGNPVEEHPAYCGICYFVCARQTLGTERTLVPNIEVVVSRYPKRSWQDLINTNVESDCEPVSCIVDMMQNSRYGMGIPDSRLDTDGLATVSALVYAEFGISPLIDQAEDFRTFLVRCLEYFDGYATSTADGKFTIGLHREVDCIEDDPSIPYYDEESLTEPPKLLPASWESTLSMVWVKFTNRDLGFLPDARMGQCRSTFELLGEPTPMSLDRSWFTRPDIADVYARTAAQINGLPRHGGTIKVRKSKLGPAAVGGIFKLNWLDYGLCWQICRILEIVQADPYTPEVEIQFELDRGYFVQQTYVPIDYTPVTPITISPADLQGGTVLEMPYTIEGGEHPLLVALAARSTKQTGLAYVLQLRASGSETRLALHNFAFTGTLYADFLQADTGALSVSLDGADVTLPDTISSLNTALDEWLVFAGDEILSIQTATLTDATTNTYSLTVGRERFDTGRLDHFTGDRVFIISRQKLQGCVFSPKDDTAAGTVVDCKIQPVAFGQAVDEASLATRSVTLTDRAKRQWKPRNLAVNGTAWYDGPTFTTGSDFTITWDSVNRNYPKPWEVDLPDIIKAEIRTLADSVVWSNTYAGSTESISMTNAGLVAVLGSEDSFKFRVYSVAAGADALESRYYDEATVTLV